MQGKWKREGEGERGREGVVAVYYGQSGSDSPSRWIFSDVVKVMYQIRASGPKSIQRCHLQSAML